MLELNAQLDHKMPVEYEPGLVTGGGWKWGLRWKNVEGGCPKRHPDKYQILGRNPLDHKC